MAPLVHRAGEGDDHVTGDPARRLDQLVDGGVAGVAALYPSWVFTSVRGVPFQVIEEIVRSVVPQFHETPTRSSRLVPVPVVWEKVMLVRRGRGAG